MVIKALMLTGAVFLASLTVNAGQLLKMRTSPMLSAPADLFVYVSVERRAQNRLLVVSAESQDFFRSSEVQLDGEESPRVAVFDFRQLPAGYYVVEAELIGSNGRTADVARSNVNIY